MENQYVAVKINTTALATNNQCTGNSEKSINTFLFIVKLGRGQGTSAEETVPQCGPGPSHWVPDHLRMCSQWSDLDYVHFWLDDSDVFRLRSMS